MRELNIQFLHNVSKYLKLNKFCKELGIAPSNLSNTLKYGSRALSDEKLQELVDLIKTYAKKFA